jgi:hypothetical protein
VSKVLSQHSSSKKKLDVMEAEEVGIFVEGMSEEEIQ